MEGIVNKDTSKVSSVALPAVASGMTAYNNYAKRSGNVVTLQFQASCASAITVGATLFTIPSGYAPPADTFFTALSTSNGVILLQVGPDSIGFVWGTISAGSWIDGCVTYITG